MKFLKLFNKSTEKPLNKSRYQSSLLKKMITSSSNDIINDYTNMKIINKYWAFHVLIQT